MSLSMFEITSVDVLGSPMEVFVFKPSGVGPHPGILLAQHIPMGHTGIENDTFTLSAAQRFVEQGFIVVVPFIFHWWPKSEAMELKKNESRDDHIVADMQAGMSVLLAQQNIDVDKLAIVGHCWGGRVAWLAACHIKQIAALAVFYGGNIKKALGEGNAAPISLAHNIGCPVIGFFGNEDTNPSPEDVDDYSAALSDAGVSHEFFQYDDAGHAFQNFPSSERYNELASNDAWEKVFEFLKETLGMRVKH